MPIGLLKLGALYKSRGWDVRLVCGNTLLYDFEPQHILVTSLFTYWSRYVADAALYYHAMFPHAKLIVGGIFASLLPDVCKRMTGADQVFVGIHEEAERFEPDYGLLDEELDYEILHSSRGCVRRCGFCYTWKIEPEFYALRALSERIHKNRVVLYDNNFLANPFVEDLLDDLAKARVNGRPVQYECQSGFDGRLLTPFLAQKLKRAHFVYPRIAWDGPISDCENIRTQLGMLIDAGYQSKSISVFMLYNWDIPFKQMELKRLKVWEWKVQITDCRFRPVTQLYDHFDARKPRGSDAYFIHGAWTDDQIKQFRRNVRRQNICVRHGIPFHSSVLERKSLPRHEFGPLKRASRDTVIARLPDAWFPDDSSTRSGDENHAPKA